MIDCYHNKQSNDHILSWHNDIGIRDINNPNALKIFYNAADATFSTKKAPAVRINLYQLQMPRRIKGLACGFA